MSPMNRGGNPFGGPGAGAPQGLIKQMPNGPSGPQVPAPVSSPPAGIERQQGGGMSGVQGAPIPLQEAHAPTSVPGEAAASGYSAPNFAVPSNAKFFGR